MEEFQAFFINPISKLNSHVINIKIPTEKPWQYYESTSN